MKTYYHYTTESNTDNYVLGYITADKDFVSVDDSHDFNLILKIVAKKGLIPMGWCDYINQATVAAIESLKI